ncbi:DUF3489 domain-containing protein [Oceanibium sediminis]|uniref:DUF3489 domain-containing protein n=1 Tax=Oceanibium sediminis TaxID=2026339 RepID=UPI000DD35A75|nr:DUF3489 domain-containing protein [Oceanibium sediminis]
MKETTRTKRSELIRLLQRKSGADLTTITSKLEWQPHTVRAAISGLRKSGHTIERAAPDKPGGCAVYRLTGLPGSAR